MGQHVTIERVQCRIVDVRLEDAFAQVIEDNDSGRAAQPAKGLLVQFRPHTAARTKDQQTHRLAAVSQRHHEQPGAAIFAATRIAHHRAGAVVDLCLFARRGHDDCACFRATLAAQAANIPLYALIAAGKTVLVDQVLPDRHRIAALRQRQLDRLTVRLTNARSVSWTRFFHTRAGGHLHGRF
jgi:hypothetical protein